MALSKHERKERLGYGSLTKIAKKTGRALGHVSQVVSGTRRDRKVEREVARRLGISIEEAFGPGDTHQAHQSSTAA